MKLLCYTEFHLEDHKGNSLLLTKPLLGFNTIGELWKLKNNLYHFYHTVT